MNHAPSLRTADAAGIATLAAMSGASFLVLQSFAGAFGIVALTVVKGGVAAGFLAPWLRVPARRAALRRHLGRLFALSLLASTLPFALTAYAAPRLGAGTVAVLHATAPLAAALVGAAWLGERPGRAQLGGFALGLAGVVLLALDRLGGAADGAAVALLAGLAAAIATATGTQVARHRLGGVDPVVLTIATQGGSAVTLALPAWWLWPAQSPGAGAWAGVLALGVLGSGLGWVLHYRLVQRIGAPRAMTVTFLAPLAAMLFEFLVFGHAPAGPAVFGAGLVLAGTALGAGLRVRAG